jgi:hypothetical protein
MGAGAAGRRGGEQGTDATKDDVVAFFLACVLLSDVSSYSLKKNPQPPLINPQPPLINPQPSTLNPHPHPKDKPKNKVLVQRQDPHLFLSHQHKRHRPLDILDDERSTGGVTSTHQTPPHRHDRPTPKTNVPANNRETIQNNVYACLHPAPGCRLRRRTRHSVAGRGGGVGGMYSCRMQLDPRGELESAWWPNP